MNSAVRGFMDICDIPYLGMNGLETQPCFLCTSKFILLN